MAAPGTGHGSYVQIGREAAGNWGVKVAATRRFRVVKSDFKGQRGKVLSDALTDTVAHKTMFSGPQVAGGTLELEADYAGQMYLWDGVMGTATYGANGGTSAGGGPYVWSFFQRALLNSYTIEDIAGPIPASKCNVLTGAKIKSLVISGSGGLDAKPLRIAIEWVAKDFTTDQTPTAGLTANTPAPVMFHHLDTTSFKSGTADVAGSERIRSFEIAINNPLTDDRWYGADAMDEMLRADFADPTFKWTMEFATKSAMDDYMNATLTSRAPIVSFVSGAANSLGFDAGVGYIVTPINRPVDKYGLLLQDFTVQALDDGGSPSTGIRVINGNSSATIS